MGHFRQGSAGLELKLEMHAWLLQGHQVAFEMVRVNVRIFSAKFALFFDKKG